MRPSSAGIDRLFDTIDEPSAETVAIVSTLEEAASGLEHLASEAGKIREVLEDDRDEDATVDCARIARHLVGDYRDRYPDASIETDLPNRLEIAGGPRLSVALEHLIENAVEHNPADEPTVWIRASVTAADEWVDLTVEDDGPPIPDAERAVITGERPITQTEHGLGLGLWLVAWTVEQFGGEVLFEESDIGGNSVLLRLPRPSGG